MRHIEGGCVKKIWREKTWTWTAISVKSFFINYINLVINGVIDTFVNSIHVNLIGEATCKNDHNTLTTSRAHL